MKHVGDTIREVATSEQNHHSENWQGKGGGFPMVELLHYHAEYDLGANIELAGRLFQPKRPWADVHFEERVSGIPLNPPPSHKLWAPGTEDYYEGGESFSHTYPERFWSHSLHTGIRYDIADLYTLVRVLKKDPATRQAYLPMFFPEDLTAAEEGDRVPCSLGWQFIIRDGAIDCFYPIRSCDVFRHLRNDLYLANRLVLWLLEETGIEAVPGKLIFHATSLHCFASDIPLYKRGLIK